jgi:hypothetical protein
MMLSCSNHEHFKSEYIFINKDGDFCYLMDGKIHSIYLDGYPSNYYLTGYNRFSYDSIQNLVVDLNNDDELYYPIDCASNSTFSDTIYMANSLFGLSQGIGVLFNAKIIGDLWQVGVYYPNDFIGTYEFHITNSELNLFDCAIDKFIKKISIFQDTNYYQKSESVLLVKMSNSEETTISKIDEHTYTTMLVNDLSMIIIKKHLKKYNRISDEISYTEIRKKIKNDAIKSKFKLFE